MSSFNDRLRARSELMSAIHRSNVKVACAALMQGADATSDNNRPIRVAAIRGNLDMIRLLVSAGADLHAADDKVMGYACREGNVPVVRYVLAQGVDLIQIGERMLRDAILGYDEKPKENFEVIRLLVERQDFPREIDHLMAFCAHICTNAQPLMRYFLEQGFSHEGNAMAQSIHDEMQMSETLSESNRSAPPSFIARRGAC